MAEEAGAKGISELVGKELSGAAAKAAIEAAAKDAFGAISGIGWHNTGRVINEGLADGLKTVTMDTTAASQSERLAAAMAGRAGADTTAHVVGEGAGTLAERETLAATEATEKAAAEVAAKNSAKALVKAEAKAAAEAIAKTESKAGVKATVKKFAGKNAGKIAGGLVSGAATTFVAYQTFKKGKQLFDDSLHDLEDVRNGFRDYAIDLWMHALLSSLGVPEDQICKIETALATGILVVGAVVVVYEIKKNI